MTSTMAMDFKPDSTWVPFTKPKRQNHPWRETVVQLEKQPKIMHWEIEVKFETPVGPEHYDALNYTAMPQPFSHTLHPQQSITVLSNLNTYGQSSTSTQPASNQLHNFQETHHDHQSNDSDIIFHGASAMPLNDCYTDTIHTRLHAPYKRHHAQLDASTSNTMTYGRCVDDISSPPPSHRQKLLFDDESHHHHHQYQSTISHSSNIENTRSSPQNPHSRLAHAVSLPQKESFNRVKTSVNLFGVNERGQTICVRIVDWCRSILLAVPDDWSESQINDKLTRWSKSFITSATLKQLFQWKLVYRPNFMGFEPKSEEEPLERRIRRWVQLTIPNEYIIQTLKNHCTYRSHQMAGFEILDYPHFPWTTHFITDTDLPTSGWFWLSSWREVQHFTTHAQIEVECSYKDIVPDLADTRIAPYTIMAFDIKAKGDQYLSPNAMIKNHCCMCIHMHVYRYNIEAWPDVIPLEHEDIGDLVEHQHENHANLVNHTNHANHDIHTNRANHANHLNHQSSSTLFNASSLNCDDPNHYNSSLTPSPIGRHSNAKQYLQQFKPIQSHMPDNWCVKSHRFNKKQHSNICKSFITTPTIRNYCLVFCPDQLKDYEYYRLPTLYENDQSDGIFVISLKSELTMIELFRDMLVTIQPESIRGHNTNFHWRYLFDRVGLLSDQQVPYVLPSDVYSKQSSHTHHDREEVISDNSDGEDRNFYTSTHDTINNNKKKRKQKNDQKNKHVEIEVITDLRRRQATMVWHGQATPMKSRYYFMGRSIYHMHRMTVSQSYSEAKRARLLFSMNLHQIADIDALHVVMDDPKHKYRNYRLDFLAKKILNDDGDNNRVGAGSDIDDDDHDDDHDGTIDDEGKKLLNQSVASITQMFENRQYVDIVLYGKYDCDIVIGLLNALRFDLNQIFISRLTYSSLPTMLRHAQQFKITNLLYYHGYKQGFAFQPKPIPKTGYKGAILIPPKKGYYTDYPTLVLDYFSMFPTIMQDSNLCFSTLYYPEQDQVIRHRWHSCVSDEKLMSRYGPKVYPADIQGNPLLESAHDVMLQRSTAWTVSLEPVPGAPKCTFVQHNYETGKGPQGLLPRLISEFKNKRNHIRHVEQKKLISNRQYHDGQSWINMRAKSEYEALDSLQMCIKIIINSFYGSTGARFGFFSNPWVAQFVVAMERIHLQFTKDWFEFEKNFDPLCHDYKIMMEKVMHQLNIMKPEVDHHLQQASTQRRQEDIRRQLARDRKFGKPSHRALLQQHQHHGSKGGVKLHTSSAAPSLTSSMSLPAPPLLISPSSATSLFSSTMTLTLPFLYTSTSLASHNNHHDFPMWIKIICKERYLGAALLSLMQVDTLQVINGDTDSIMCQDKSLGKIVKDNTTGLASSKYMTQVLARGEAMSEQFTNYLRQLGLRFATLLFEKCYLPYLLIGMKASAGLVWVKADHYKELEKKQCGTGRNLIEFVCENTDTLLLELMIKSDPDACLSHIKRELQQLVDACKQPFSNTMLKRLTKTKQLAQIAYVSTTKQSTADQKFEKEKSLSTINMSVSHDIYNQHGATRSNDMMMIDDNRNTSLNHDDNSNGSKDTHHSQHQHTHSSILSSQIQPIQNNHARNHDSPLKSSLSSKTPQFIEPEHVMANKKFEDDFPGCGYNTGSRVEYLVLFDAYNPTSLISNRTILLEHYLKLKALQQQGHTIADHSRHFKELPTPDIPYYIRASEINFQIILQYCPGYRKNMFEEFAVMAHQTLMGHHITTFEKIILSPFKLPDHYGDQQQDYTMNEAHRISENIHIVQRHLEKSQRGDYQQLVQPSSQVIHFTQERDYSHQKLQHDTIKRDAHKYTTNKLDPLHLNQEQRRIYEMLK